MSQEPKVTRFGADPTVDQELATKAYVDASHVASFITGGFFNNSPLLVDNFIQLNGVIWGTVEIIQQTPFSNDCTLRRITIHISVSTTDEVTDCRLRINGVNGNQVITIASTTTGVFQDLINTDVISSGDLVGYLFEILGSANSLIIPSMMIEVIP